MHLSSKRTFADGHSAARIYLSRVEKVAFVRGDAEVDFEYVADVIDLVHHIGVQRVGLMTQDQKLADE